MLLFREILLLASIVCSIKCAVDWSADEFPKKWNDYAKFKIEDNLKRTVNGKVAKNVILFLGDGMGVSTVTAGRIRKGQIQGRNGEEEVTHMESFPHLSLSKTYNIDAQTPDSAGTATAYLCGVKTRIGVIGLDGRAFDCPSSANSKVESIVRWAHYAGKSTGIVTTTRVTHATPSAAYAHAYSRDWEGYDGYAFTETLYNQGCRDIAAQLIDDNSFINVIHLSGFCHFSFIFNFI
jgi:alkaline phosphatase